MGAGEVVSEPGRRNENQYPRGTEFPHGIMVMF